MIYTVLGRELTIQVESKGAELISVKENKTGREYLWNANPTFWGHTSPVLFPFVGRVKNGVYRHEGKTYEMGPHGFVRNMECSLLNQNEDSIWLSVSDTPQTREVYPFSFTLEIGYVLEEKSVRACWRVKNNGSQTMYFALGGHPALACPPDGAGKRTGQYLWFDKPDFVASSAILPTGLTCSKRFTCRLDNGYLPISTGLFDDDALVLENDQAHSVSLCDAEQKPYVRVDFDAPLFGVWSMPSDDAGFICVEPWFGRCDSDDFTGELKERAWENALAAGGVFEKEYRITIL